jgi:ERCC4-related helicase
MITPYHAKYFANELTKRCPSNSIEKLASSLADAQVDLNPHQIEAALFAFRSPLSKGAILADEVGLGKTVEAGIVIAQRWAERQRRILIITPANLRKQWSQELADKFFLQSTILEAKSFNQEIARGNLNPFILPNIVLCSYQFARTKEPYVKQVPWDLVVIDEAHRLRNVYKPQNKIANALKNALQHAPKILLTATPLQNSLLELFGLVSIVDDFVFGDIKSFRSQFGKLTGDDNFTELKQRLKPVCIRTLRRQVLEYINYTNRIAIVQEFVPHQDEQRLYDLVSEYLQREELFALPKSQRKLMTLILRKLLASSTFAISATLNTLAERLEATLSQATAKLEPEDAIAQDYEALDELSDEWEEDEEEDSNDQPTKKQLDREEIQLIKDEIAALKEFMTLATSITKNSKGQSLLTALRRGFTEQEKTGAPQKALIFTESRRTQEYLLRLLQEAGYGEKIVLFNGTNNDPISNRIYEAWLKKHEGTDRITGSPTSDKRAALVEYFRDEAVIMIATEAAAEGVNLQFCSLVVNYDLPWNPQRVEQRIGRCHRYGQKFDVVVVNFLNKNNEADQRVYNLLAEKFKLFDGVFGASDEVLGTISSGVDFEKRIAEIYQRCRSPEEIKRSFDELQQEMDQEITGRLTDTRQKLLENFDEEVHEKLRIRLDESKVVLSKYENWLWQITRFYLNGFAEFGDDEHSFVLAKNPFPEEVIHPGPYRVGKNVEDVNLYRLGHPLAQKIVSACASKEVPQAELNFSYSDSPVKITIIDPLIGKSGWLKAQRVTVTTFEAEDYVLLSAITEDGQTLDDDQCRRMFSIGARVHTPTVTIPTDKAEKLNNILTSRELEIFDELSSRNASFFENEIIKLDSWAADVKSALENEIKELDKQIREFKKEASLAGELEKKIELHRSVKELEKARHERRKSLFEAQDQIDEKKEQLLSSTEQRLQQHVNREDIFTIRWSID